MWLFPLWPTAQPLDQLTIFCWSDCWRWQRRLTQSPLHISFETDVQVCPCQMNYSVCRASLNLQTLTRGPVLQNFSFALSHSANENPVCTNMDFLTQIFSYFLFLQFYVLLHISSSLQNSHMGNMFILFPYPWHAGRISQASVLRERSSMTMRKMIHLLSQCDSVTLLMDQFQAGER